MTAKISTSFGEATIEDGVWSAQDKGLEEFLDTVCNPNDMHGYLPNPDLNAAEAAIKELPGATIISFTKVNRPTQDGVLY